MAEAPRALEDVRRTPPPPPPVSSVHIHDDASLVSGVTEVSSASLFRGPLYPSADSLALLEEDEPPAMPTISEGGSSIPSAARTTLQSQEDEVLSKKKTASAENHLVNLPPPPMALSQNPKNKTENKTPTIAEGVSSEEQTKEDLTNSNRTTFEQPNIGWQDTKEDPIKTYANGATSKPMLPADPTTTKGILARMTPKEKASGPALANSSSSNQSSIGTRARIYGSPESDAPVGQVGLDPQHQWTSEIQPLPQQQRTESVSTPGAFRVLPMGVGNPYVEQEDYQEQEGWGGNNVEQSNCNENNDPDVEQGREQGNDYDTSSCVGSLLDELTQATPVDLEEEFEELAQAVPVQRKQKTKRFRLEEDRDFHHYRYCLLAIWCAAVIAVGTMIGLLLTGAFEDSDARSPVPSPTGSPTVYSKPRTAVPTAFPTSPVDDLVATLPNFTLESLKDPFSHQSQALQWLRNHRNITNLPEWRKTQLFAMATYYYALDGPNWPSYIRRSWLDDSIGECLWFTNTLGTFDENGTFQEGFLPAFNDDGEETAVEHCNTNTGEVIDLTLEGLASSEGFQAKIPPEISLLSSLKELYVYSSDFGGDLDSFVPPELYQMTSLEEFGIWETNLTGTIPTQVGLMTALEGLYLDTNKLTGGIPSQIASMSKLTSLMLYSNYLTGTLPSLLGQLTEMSHVIELDGNFFTGTIPTEFGRLTELKSLWLAYNAELSGALPLELGNMAALDTLQVQGTQLRGTMPSELGLLKVLKRLDFGDLELLTGTIPVQVASISNLTQANFAGTGLSGTLPQSICLLEEPDCATLISDLGDYQCYLDFNCSNTLCGCGCDCLA